jgi:cytidylate kinase
VPLLQDDHVVQQVSTYAPDPALRDAVLPRTSEGCSDRQYPVVLHGRNDITIELLIAIENQELVRLLIFPGLT